MKRLKDLWDNLPDLPHTIKYYDDSSKLNIYEVCGRKFQETAPVSVIIDCLQGLEDTYGERAKLAKENMGIDWKAIHHAFRAGLQLKEIYQTGDLIYPLKDSNFLLDIKQGKYHYQNDDIAIKLDDLIDEIELLAEKSSLPKEVDKEFWNNWLLDLYCVNK